MAKRRHWPVIRFPTDEREECARSDAVARLKELLPRPGASGAATTELRQAWDVFFAVYLPQIREVVQRHRCPAASVDDYVQAICAGLIAKRTPRRHEPERGTFDYWLSLVIHRRYVNLALAEREKEKVEQPSAADAPDIHTLSVVASVELIELRHQLTTAMKATLSELSPKHARIIELRYGNGFSVSKVSELAMIAPKTIESSCRRVARAFLVRADQHSELGPLLSRLSMSAEKIFQNSFAIVQNSPGPNGTVYTKRQRDNRGTHAAACQQLHAPVNVR